jgi:hypothetical protein
MSGSGAAPVVDSLDPPEVEQGSTVELAVLGRNFDEGSFVLIDGMSPRIVARAAERLDVELTREITETSGAKVVIVHNGDGRISDPVELGVTMSPGSFPRTS